MIRNPMAAAALLALLATPAAAQTPPSGAASSPPSASGASDGTMLLTVFLRHDQAKNLKEINEQLFKQGYYDQFPPAGVEVASWYVVMGIGQIVTLKFPAEKLRAVNVALENTAWGPYRTDFYAAYEYKELAAQQRRTMQARPKPAP